MFADIGDDSFLSQLVIFGDFKMGEVSGVDGYVNNHTLSKKGWDSNNGDMSSGNGFINSHTLSQCNNSITFEDMVGDVEKGYVSSVYGPMKIHTVY